MIGTVRTRCFKGKSWWNKIKFLFSSPDLQIFITKHKLHHLSAHLSFSRDTWLLPVQSPLHHATEIASHYSDRKASRSAFLPRAAHVHTKVMSGILKSSLFKYDRKMEEEEMGQQSCFTINFVFSHVWHYRVLSNGQRTAASWCFLQKRTIKALDRKNCLMLCE